MTGLFQYVSSKYENIVPDKECGLLLVILYQKIKNKEIEETFTYRDVERCVQEIAVAEMKYVKPRAHDRLEKLMKFYIERPPNSAHNKYALTDFALNFLKLIEHKFDNPLAKLPLRKSFEKYGGLEASSIETIEDLEEWYRNGFESTTRNNVMSHLDGLNDKLMLTIDDLKDVLYVTDEGVLEKVNVFNDRFKLLGEQASEISDALSMKNKVTRELGDIVNAFYHQLENYKYPNTQEEQEENNKLEQRYSRAQSIQDEVKAFFKKVDYGISLLQEKIMYANDRLNDLKDNFEYKSKFNTNAVKLLHLALEESSYSKDGIKLAAEFPRKSVLKESVKYNRINYVNYGITVNNEVLYVRIDPVMHKQEMDRINKVLDRQQRISELANLYKNTLDLEKQMDFTEKFYEILSREDDIETAIQVGFEIIQYATHSDAFRLEIEKSLSDDTLNETVLTWKTKIHSELT